MVNRCVLHWVHRVVNEGVSVLSFIHVGGGHC